MSIPAGADALFGIPSPLDDPSPPRWRMCPHPARWLARQGVHAAYCAGNSCRSRQRLCQICSRAFVVGEAGAGNKYCSTKCKAAGYASVRTYLAGQPSRQPECGWCGKACSPTAGQPRAWPRLCTECLTPIAHLVHRLKAHHVSHERARRLLADPGCEVCGRDIVAKVKNPDTGKTRALLVVDHDHACCPVDPYSCGQCVRGLVCMPCNIAAGMISDDPAVAHALGQYLAGFRLSRLAVGGVAAGVHVGPQ